MERNYNDLITGIILMALSIVMFIATFNIEALTTSRVGADFMPKIIAVLIAIMSIPVIVSGLKGREEDKNDDKTLVSDQDEISHTEAEEETDNKNSYVSLMITIVLLFVYLFLIPILGFLITTAVYLIIQMLLFSEWTIRNVTRYTVISIVISPIVYYLFRNAFYVMLPAGILG